MKVLRSFSTLLIIALYMCFTSCGDDDKRQTLLSETWVAEYYNKEGKRCEDTLTFQSDGTGSWTPSIENAVNNKYGSGLKFRYTYNENTARVTFDWQYMTEGYPRETFLLLGARLEKYGAVGIEESSKLIRCLKW